jgi:MYXO-CTERM domain-containing protein
MRRSTLVVLLAVAPLLSLACQLDGEPGVETGSAPIIGGNEDPGDPSVVMLSIQGGRCTGTLVSPRVVLTAGHCVSDAIEAGNSDQGRVHFGGGASNGGFDLEIGIADMVMYRLYEPPAFLQYDLAMIRLETPADGYTPLPINFEKLTDDYIGLPLRTVGFGVTDGEAQTGSGTKRQIDLTLDELTYFHIGLGDTSSNICQGDSGGPTFATFDGEERVVGVASFGSGACGERSYITRTDIYQDWIDGVMDAWDGPCQLDGTCVTDGCRTPDPDCDVCGFDGSCGDECAQPDLDCPLGARIGDTCDDEFDCESRVCLTAPETDAIRYCSEECDPADEEDACSTPLGACVERDGRYVCQYNGQTPGTQGDECGASDECRVGVCDPDDAICVAQCGDGYDACPDGFECRALGSEQACRLPEAGGCGGCATGTGASPWLIALAALALVARRRRA